ncbi:MAG: hypothetical protein HYR70_12195 [Chloroflexi bacterium]|nr:hypothetical protein [Chloroflexota bacterium]MBI3339391.1 hypothetical protein [Chloroflexota bacterium]
MPANQTNELDHRESSLSVISLISFFAAVALGALTAAVLLPNWAPSLAQSLAGDSPKAYWYLSRGTAFVSLGLLWLSMALGLLITNKTARTWPGTAAAFAIHEYVSLLGLAFGIFHALILLGERYIGIKLVEILVPFAAVNYRPLWVGLGQVSLYVWAIVSASFYVRQRIGSKTWRLIHFASFFTFLTALFHGLASGSDTSQPWAQAVYWSLGGSLLFLTLYRIVTSLFPAPSPSAAPRPVSQTTAQR